MQSEPVLIGGRWQTEGSARSFCAVNPVSGEPLPKRFPISERATIEQALVNGSRAAADLESVAPEAVALFLERCADAVESRAARLVATAHLETGLPVEPRLMAVELPRTTDQLRQAANAVRQRAFCAPVIDTKANIRSLYAALGGPVVILGPNNFPFAFNAVMGGDFAAAIAAGNPVIAKAHPRHPETSRLLAEAAFDALQRSELPHETVQMFYHVQQELGLELVSDPRVAATAFTGSRHAGLALKAAADRAGRPIYLEMSSVNPVFVLPGALAERSEEIARELFGACTLGAGQFCTNPGLSVLISEISSSDFLRQLQRLFATPAQAPLFSKAGVEQLSESIQVLTQAGARLICGGQAQGRAGFYFGNSLLTSSAANFLEHAQELQTEAFGAAHLVVQATNFAELLQVARVLDGSLTGCIYSAMSGRDDQLYTPLAEVLRTRVGRLLNDKMPTGVAVSPAMNHGGPYPATAHAGFTAVGIPASIRRFTALHCYDNVRPHRLPKELADLNPTGAWRMVDGTWTRDGIAENSD